MRKQIFALLRDLDLRPLEWETLVAMTKRTAPTLLEVVRNALSRTRAVIALLTPDDVVRLHRSLWTPGEPRDEREATMQPRPNVLLELGMALGVCPNRTIILQVGTMRPVTDLGGVNVIRFDGTDVPIGKLIQRLRMAECPVDDSGSDWRSTRRFADLTAYQREAD